MESAWEELGKIHGKCLELCSEVSIALQDDVLGVPTEHFTSCGDFKTKATVRDYKVQTQSVLAYCFVLSPGWNHDKWHNSR
jgi:hypothetical protein